MTTKDITVKVSIGDKDVEKTGKVNVVENSSDVLTMLQEDESAVIPKDATDAEKSRIRNRTLALVNYALDLKARAAISNQIRTENVDPNKANDKAFEQFNKARLANGKTAVSIEKFKEIMGE